MVARHKQFVRRSTSSNKSWTASTFATRLNIPANSKVLLGLFALSNPGIDETVLRTIIDLYLISDTNSTESQMGAIGMIVVNDIAGGIGVTAVPGPATDADNDGWFIHQHLNLRQIGPTAVGQFQGRGYEINSKAKRVVHDGSTLALMAENLHATEAFDILINLRLLSMVRGT